MVFIEIFFVAIGLAMDAFAVSVCKGLSMKNITLKKEIIVGIYFGLFQGGMPIIGYLLGTSFESMITKIDHWIAFVLLLLIGGNMLKDAFSKGQEKSDDKIDFKSMFPLALATSIDALALGVTFAFLDVNIFLASFVICVVTLILSVLGVILGHKFGDSYEKKAQMLGGVILVIMGFKILFEHLNIFL